MGKDIAEKYKCIKKLKEHADFENRNYFEKWENIKKGYKELLNSDLFTDEKQFTPHDYDRHCVNIYKILDIIIPDIDINNIECNDKFNVEHLFILDVAVILHDIYMFINPDKRSTHSKEAKCYIMEQIYKFRESNSLLKINLSDDEANFVAEVVYGHSDEKSGDGKIIISTIDELPESNFKNGALGPVNVKLLSALLRLADELDITNDRVRGKYYLERRIGRESDREWRKCKIFATPTKAPNDSRILHLRLNEERIKIDDNFENDIELIIEVWDKISTEFKKLHEKVFVKRYLNGWDFSIIDIFTEDESLKNAISEHTNNKTPLGTMHIIEREDSVAEHKSSKTDDKLEDKNSREGNIIIIDEEFSKTLEKWVIKDNLLKSGHFFIDDSRCARDWIDTHQLFKNLDYMRKISDQFLEYIRNKFQQIEDIYIIGHGFPALILSSIIAFKCGIPFPYIIPKKMEKLFTHYEKDIELKKDSKIIIFTDVVVTGLSIKNTIDFLTQQYNIEFKNIINIFTVFYRKPMNILKDSKCNNPLKSVPIIINKLVALNCSIDIELCGKKENCFFRDNDLIEHKYEYYREFSSK